ncbi:GNAT family N-acetyltransferase [Kiloniella antarctica]|uniref:GNAT family N-acetyltransferase n=1 Tax=Kiloniella antarctica TaxID=1550907 RepID=A0ABW5BSR1_9PROT
MKLTYKSADTTDLETLVAIRVTAMKTSLENLGRFDLDRARSRFTETFVPEHTTNIMTGKDIIGFYVLKYRENHLWLDHLYIKPGFQGTGVGTEVLSDILSKAKNQGVSVKLCALKESKANDFYKSHGFVLTHSEEWDNYYIYD